MHQIFNFRYWKENSWSDDAGLVNKKSVIADRDIPNHTLIFFLNCRRNHLPDGYDLAICVWWTLWSYTATTPWSEFPWETLLSHCHMGLSLNFLRAAINGNKLYGLGFSKHSEVISEMLLISQRALFGRRSHSILQMRSATASPFHHRKSGKGHNTDKSGNKPGAALRFFCTPPLILIVIWKKKIIWTS